MVANSLFLEQSTVRDLGTHAVWLGMSLPEWMRRRKTTYSFIDEATLALRITIDFSLPNPSWFLVEPPAEGAPIYVPLQIASKEHLSSFRVLDDSGGSVSVLNAAENGQLAVDGFMAVMPDVADVDVSELREPIERIVTARNVRAGLAAFEEAMRGPLGRVLGQDQERALLRDLATGYLVLVAVPYVPGAHHVYELQWSHRFVWTLAGVGGGMRALAASLGIVSKALRLEDLPIGWARSTHFEFLPPEDVRCVETVLATKQYDPEVGGPIEIARRRVVAGDSQPTVSVPIRDTVTPVACRADVGTVSLRMRPRRSGTFMAIATVAFITTALLFVMAERLARLDAESSSAIMLVLPALLAAFLARSGEHAIASRLLVGVRLLGLFVAALAIVAAVLIGVGELRVAADSEASPTAECAVEGMAPRALARRGTLIRVRFPELGTVGVRCWPPEPQEQRANAGIQTTFMVLFWASFGATVVLLVGIASTTGAAYRASRRDPEDNAEAGDSP